MPLYQEVPNHEKGGRTKDEDKMKWGREMDDLFYNVEVKRAIELVDWL